MSVETEPVKQKQQQSEQPGQPRPKIPAIIHLLIESPQGKIKSAYLGGEKHGIERTFDVACMPGTGLPRHASGETGAVTCLLCKATSVYAEKVEADKAAEVGAGTLAGGEHPADAAARAAMEQQGMSCCG